MIVRYIHVVCNMQQEAKAFTTVLDVTLSLCCCCIPVTQVAPSPQSKQTELTSRKAIGSTP